MNSWVGVDLDGTLAYYDHWRGDYHIGDPIPRMVDTVNSLLESGLNVKIFTARASGGRNTDHIKDWCEKHIGRRLEVTAENDFEMQFLIDDRCFQVIPNTGAILMAGQA